MMRREVCKLGQAEVVRDKVEQNLLIHAECLSSSDTKRLIEAYHRLIALTDPELAAYPASALVNSSRHPVRHLADVPVLLSAMIGKPDWLLTHNTKHFTKVVAERSALRIATPAGFFKELASLLQ